MTDKLTVGQRPAAVKPSAPAAETSAASEPGHGPVHQSSGPAAPDGVDRKESPSGAQIAGAVVDGVAAVTVPYMIVTAIGNILSALLGGSSNSS